ncbi:MAG: STAS domain-containing protein [Acidobacteriota bacterium]|nr:STAS domain-containing protein [Acidobacteriota bacterium]
MTPLPTFADETALVPPCVTHELIRGKEQNLLEQITPMVRNSNVALDMSRIDRIDAAGIAVLITLFERANAAGHRFAVIHATHRVAEILALVGLDHILIASDKRLSFSVQPAA